MYETEATHLYPSIKKCPICRADLKEWYRNKGKLVRTLKGEKYIVQHIYRCENKKCKEKKVKIEPEENSRIVLKHCQIGIDIMLEIGRLRHKEYKTFYAIKQELMEKYNVRISEKDVGNQNRTYLTLMNMLMKDKNSSEWKKLEKLEGMVLAIDGIKPDLGDDVLMIVREIQTGYVVAAKMLNYASKNEVSKLLRKIKEMPFPVLGIVSDNEGMITGAIKEELPKVPHQLCQYHFLKRLSKKIKAEDGKLKKKC